MQRMPSLGLCHSIGPTGISKLLVSLKDNSEIFLVGICQATLNFGEMPSNHFV